MALNSFGNYLLLYTLFHDRNENLSHNERFLLCSQHKTVKKNIGATFPEGIEGLNTKTPLNLS